MTDQRRARGAEKRERLVEGAQRVFYRQGVERSSLADVAEEASVGIGNIYYYFKTKDELVDAIVESYSQAREEMILRLERRRTPQSRLRGFLEELDATRTVVSEHGCPIGTLSSEMDKQCGAEPSSASRALLGPMVDWVERQFMEMGRSDARDLAVTLISTYEGATILAHSQRDPDLLHRQSLRLARWIDALADHADPALAPAG